MTPARAYAIASQWGSYMRSGDPGACFYSFRHDDARPVSAVHRQDCISYTDGLLSQPKLPDADRRSLLSLRAFFQSTELAPVEV